MKLALLAGFLMLLGVAGILVGTILRVNEHYIDERIDYGIILNAGSTSTKAYIYQWQHKTQNFIPPISLGKSKSKEPYIYMIQPGVDSLNPNVTAVGEYLEPILSWARALIPKKSVSKTPIYMQGTGGMRQLSETTCNALLSSIRTKLMNSGFYFENDYASVLTGTEEAGYGFLAVNSLYNRFGDSENPLDPYGSLDLGGVSSEIAFKTSHAPTNNSISFSINTTVYSLYAQGNDGLGINLARNALNYSLFLNTSGNMVQNPCLPNGYYETVILNHDGAQHTFILVGTSDAAACQYQVNRLVSSLTQSLPKPAIGDTTFAVADHYLKIRDFFKLKDNANILELEAKASSFCGLNYGDAMSRHKKYANEVQYYCFNGLYAATLLEEFYGFDATMRHLLWKKVVHHKSESSWALGYMMNEVNLLAPDTSKQDRIRKVRFYHTYGGVILLFISALVFILGLVLFILQYRRPAEYTPILERQ